MKNISLYITLIFISISCSIFSENKSSFAIPTEECSLKSLRIHSVSNEINYLDEIVVESYVKKSSFDSLISLDTILVENRNNSIALPDSISTDVDIRLILENGDLYDITEFTTFWEERYCQAFCGYGCELESYRLNGLKYDYNGDIYIENIDDTFKSFLESFSKDSIFQLKRVKFPLKTSSLNRVNSETEDREILQSEYIHLNVINIDSHSCNYNVKENGVDAIFTINGIENGLIIEYSFQKLNGKWMLVSREDSST